MNDDTENSGAFVLLNSIDYAANAVVSKTIIKKPTGTVTLFSFDKGEGLSEHSAPHEALAHVFDGSAEITIGGKVNTVKAGQAIILPANIPNAVKATEWFKMMLVMIKNQ